MFINPRPHWFSLFGSCWFFFCLAHWYTWNCRPNQSHMDDLQWPSSPTYLKPSNCWVGLGGWPHHVFWKFKKLCSSPGQVLLWMLEMPRNCRPGVDNSEFLLVKDRSPNMADVIWKISDEKPGRFDAQWMKWIWGTPPEKIDGTTACCLQEYGLFFIIVILVDIRGRSPGFKLIGWFQSSRPHLKIQEGLWSCTSLESRPACSKTLPLNPPNPHAAGPSALLSPQSRGASRTLRSFWKLLLGAPVSHTLPLGKKWGLVSATPSFLVVPCHRRWRQSLQWSMSSSSGKMSSSYISGRRRRRHKHWFQHLRQNYFLEWFWMTNTHFIVRANEKHIRAD